jgi:hypothetical protein
MNYPNLNPNEQTKKSKFRKFVLVSILIIAFISTVACELEYVTYTDNINSYSMSIPKSWDIVGPWGDAVILFGGPSQCSGADITGSLILRDTHISRLQTLYAGSKLSVENERGFVFISEDETTIDSVPAMKLMYMCNDISTGDSFQAVEYCLLKGNKSWLISFNCVPECWNISESTFNTMISSFRFLD